MRHRTSSSRTTTRPSSTTRSLGLLALAGIALLGCRDDQATTDGAPVDQAPGGEVPSPGITTFTAGGFDAIELPRGADEAAEKTERDGVIAQSFFARSTSPEQIMDFFADSLPLDGWTVAEPVSSRGTDSIAGAWTKDGRRLEISALLAQGVENERTQFSVVLLPGLEPGESIEGG